MKTARIQNYRITLALVFALIAGHHLSVVAQTVSKSYREIKRVSSYSISTQTSQKHFLTLRLARGSVAAVPWKVKIKFDIRNGSAAGATILSDSLIVKEGTAHSTVQDLRTFTASGTTTQIVITLIDSIGAPPQSIFLESYPSDQTVILGASAPGISFTSGNIIWQPFTGAMGYELEIVYIDSMQRPAPSNPFSFKTPVRVVLDKNTLSYPVYKNYPSGKIHYRLRAVGRKNSGQVSRTSWSSTFTFSMDGLAFEENKNWQLVSLFAEHGKRKDVITYFDGALRKRQTLSVLNTDSITIAKDTKYDYESRESVDILPAPILGADLHYKDALHTHNRIVYNNQHHLDPNNVAALDSLAGAGRYYSTLNDFNGHVHRGYIPHAEGYPMSYRQYKNDPTGRIVRTKNIGKVFFTSGSYETQYLYGDASLEELTALFGPANTGDARYYQKNVTRDPNAQFSATYVDNSGRTVATSLLGVKPRTLDAVPFTPLSFPMNLMANNNLDREAQTSITVKKITNTESTRYAFLYSVTGVNFTHLEQELGASFCSNCVYSLSIKIVGPDGIARRPDSLVVTPASTTWSLLADSVFRAEIQKPGNCNPDSFKIDIAFRKTFDQIGEYTISKTLALQSGTIDTVFYQKLDTLIEGVYDSIVDATINEQELQFCSNNCEDYCASYGNADINCMETCQAFIAQQINDKVPECDFKLNLLKADYAPGGWIYEHKPTLALHAAQEGLVPYTFPYIIPGIHNRWQSDWPEKLVDRHPEYCQVRACYKIKDSRDWDKEFMATQRYSDAVDAGYWKPVGQATFTRDFWLGLGAAIPGDLNNDPYFIHPEYGGKKNLTVVYATVGWISIPVAYNISFPYRKMILDSLNHYTTLESGEPISVWEFVSRKDLVLGAGFQLTDIPVCDTLDNATAELFADLSNSNEVPEDLQWTIFKGIYSGMKESLHRKVLEKEDTCFVFNDPNAHFTPMPEFSNEEEAMDYAEGILDQYCDTLCNGIVNSWVYRLKEICVVPDDKATEVKSLLANYCQNTCGTDHALVALTSDILQNDPVLQQVQNILGTECLLDSIAMETPGGIQESTTNCREDCVQSDVCISLILEHLLNSPDKSIAMTAIKGIHNCYVPDPVPDWYWVINDDHIVGFSQNTKSKCEIVFLDGNIMANDIAYITSRPFTIRTGAVLPPTFPIPPGMSFLNVIVEVQTSATGPNPLYVFSSCPWPQECHTAQRPSDLTKEIFQLMQADVKQKKGGKTIGNTMVLKWNNDHVKVAQKISAVKPTVVYMDASGSIIPATKIAGIHELGEVPQTKFTLSGYTYIKSAALLTVADGNNRPRYIKAQRFSNYPSTTAAGCKTVYAEKDGKRIPEKSIKEIGDALPYYQRPSFKIEGYDYSSFIVPLTLNGEETGKKNAYIFTTCEDQKRKIDFDTVFVDKKGEAISRDKIASMYISGPDQSAKKLRVKGYSPSNVGARIKLKDGTSVNALVFTRCKVNDRSLRNATTMDVPVRAITITSAQQKCDTIYVRGGKHRGEIVPEEKILIEGESFYPPSTSIDPPLPGYRFANTIRAITIQDESGQEVTVVVALFTNCAPEKMGCDTLYIDKYDGRYSPSNVQELTAPYARDVDVSDFLQFSYSGSAVKIKTAEGEELEALIFLRCAELPGTACDTIYVEKTGQEIPSGAIENVSLPANDTQTEPPSPRKGYRFLGLATKVQTNTGTKDGFLFSNCKTCDTVYVTRNNTVIPEKDIDEPGKGFTTNDPPPPFERQGYRYTGQMTKLSLTNGKSEEGFIYTDCAECDTIYVKPNGERVDMSTVRRVDSKNPDNSTLAIDIPGYHYTHLSGKIVYNNGQTESVYFFTNCDDTTDCKTIYVHYSLEYAFESSEIETITNWAYDDSNVSFGDYTYSHRVVKIELKNGDNTWGYVFNDCGKGHDDQPDEPTKPAECEIIFTYPNGTMIQTSAMESIGDPWVSSASPTNGPSGYNYANMQVSITVKVGSRKQKVEAFVFTNCPLTTEDDCQQSTCVQLPGGEIVGPDGECSTTVQTNVDYEATVISVEDSLGVIERWDSVYANKCFDKPFREVFTATYKRMQYHFTLFYYDAAGNLVQTVPPQGVNEVTPGQEPSHRMMTVYRHNSRDQVVGQKTPDSDSTNFFYNLVGQLRFTQDAQQKVDGAFSYTKYDAQSRIIETGVIWGVSRTTIRNNIDTIAFPLASDHDLSEIVQTIYDYTDPTLCPGFEVESNLRGRVAVTLSRKKETDVICATCYRYDPVGNVKTLTQNITGLGIKRIDYDYDLISNVVNHVYYQRDSADQFIHRYEYDADSRLTKVFTSRNGILWDNDARHYYYPHGPLARLELGADSVQGLDYSYTLRGEMKAMNSNTLDPSRDPGKDNLTSGVNPGFGADSLGFTLGYFRGDYRPIDPNLTNTNKFEADLTGSGVSTQLADMYNGNISHMVKAIGKLPVHGEVYRYDQLYRLKKSDVHNNIDITNNLWPAANSNNGDYATTYSYDGNGNILTLTRNATGASKLMDNLTYHYAKDARGNALNNQLLHVDETVASASFNNDFDNTVVYTPGAPATDIFAYDKTGNLIRDYSSGIQSIAWNAYNKVDTIAKQAGQGDHLEFRYDGGQNRVAKILKPQGALNTPAMWKTQYYVTDAKGSIMATYLVTSSDTIIQDLTLMGSKRIGVLDLRNAPLPLGNIIRSTGEKKYELANHLGDIVLTATDHVNLKDLDDDGFVDSNSPSVESKTDYYPFGSIMSERNFNSISYRYGFNGMEKDDEAKGDGNSYTTEYRQYDPRICRWLSVDPKTSDAPGWSPYKPFFDNPLRFIDPDGSFEIESGKIEKGDNLTTITKQLNEKFEIDLSIEQVAKANDVKDVDKIKTGDFIKLPGADVELNFDLKTLKVSDSNYDIDMPGLSWAGTSGREGSQDKQFQGVEDEGPIPEGQYIVDPARTQSISSISNWDRVKGTFGRGTWPGLESSWGELRTWLTPSTETNTFGRGGFTIHGGAVPGSAGCIDLTSQNNAFHSWLRTVDKPITLNVKY